MNYPIGPLSGTDEGFCHQIADTFAVVGSTDQAWTEKVCAMAMARDGGLQIGNCQPIITGPDDSSGLPAATTFW